MLYCVDKGFGVQAKTCFNSFVSNQVKEEDAVYDVVDEKEYAERVKGRVEEGFIVDDDGEYVEDGRYEKFAYQFPDKNYISFSTYYTVTF